MKCHVTSEEGWPLVDLNVSLSGPADTDTRCKCQLPPIFHLEHVRVRCHGQTCDVSVLLSFFLFIKHSELRTPYASTVIVRKTQTLSVYLTLHEQLLTAITPWRGFRKIYQRKARKLFIRLRPSRPSPCQYVIRLRGTLPK